MLALLNTEHLVEVFCFIRCYATNPLLPFHLRGNAFVVWAVLMQRPTVIAFPWKCPFRIRDMRQYLRGNQVTLNITATFYVTLALPTSEVCM
jgi:hypothetical protein